MSYELRSARWIAADVLRQVVQPGDTVVDATLGNGHDTLMLCELVGETGRVIGFDIQPDAVERTRERLADAGMLSRCTLYAEGHEHLSERVTVPIRTATFNLGWLPGGDKRITTHWETTRAAISAALSLLMKGGVCTICAYPGHAAGDEERAALMAYLIGLPVLRLKSDYLAIATLGFAEILRAFFQWNALGPITNGSNLLKGYPDFGHAWAYLILIAIFIGIILLMVNSTYGRAFKAIRDDEIAAEAMGINLAHHKRLAFVISSFFAGVGGGMLAMYMGAVQALSFKSTMTYEILLIVVIGGIGSITGSVITSFLYIASVEWLLRGLDSGEFLGIQAPGLFKNGFRMAIVSVIIMLVVLFFRKGIMGDRELTDLLRRKPRKEGK